MIAITPSMVKELRERTGGGLMECKKALEATNGDIEAAIDMLRKAGKAKADKKSGRVAAEGAVIVAQTADSKNALLLEINCETDFVSRDDNFRSFMQAVAQRALQAKAKTVDELLAATLSPEGGKSIAQAREDLVAKIGENITIRRLKYMESNGIIGSYTHNNRIGVLVSLSVSDPVLAKDIAMHIAASKPLVIKAEDVSQDIINREKAVYLAQVQDSGKSADIMEKMVAGKLKKFLDELSLLNQPFVKDPNVKIIDLLKQAKAEVIAFERFEVGEGIEKEKCDFASEVKSIIS